MATFNVTGSGATATYDAPSDTITLNVPGGAGSPALWPLSMTTSGRLRGPRRSILGRRRMTV
jgi:hypothetical protein